MRILNQDRRLLNKQNAGLELKPRFILDENDQLTLVPIPPITAAQVPDYLGHPEKYLKHEWFLPGSRDGGAIFEFPFMVSLGRAILSPRALNFLMNRPAWLEYFTEAHESRAVPLLVSIVSTFEELATERGKQFRFVILPTARHLIYQDERKASPLEHLKDRLRAEGLDFFDATDPVLNELNGREICQIFAQEFLLNECGGHYNEMGSEIIAEIIRRDIEELRLSGRGHPF